MRSLVVVIALAGVVRADTADQLFDKGKKLLAEKRYKEACPTLEKVDALDPAIGAKLNVAKCYEEWGKLGQALRWYSDAERMANDTHDRRASQIHALVAEIEPKVPKLTLKVAPDADRSVGSVQLDGTRVADNLLGTAMRIDPGPHDITYTNAAGKRITKTIPVGRGDETEISLELPKQGSNVKAPPPDERPAPEVIEQGGYDPGRTRRLIGLTSAGVGVLGVSIAGILTLSARGDYKDALASHCMNKVNLCDDVGLKATHDARSLANAATGITVVSLVAIAGGAVLYFTAPKRMRLEHALYVAPTGTGAVLGGRF